MGSKNNLKPGLGAGSLTMLDFKPRGPLGCLEALASTHASQKGGFAGDGTPRTYTTPKTLMSPSEMSSQQVCGLLT